MPSPAQRKVQVAGQILLIDPPITRLPIRFGKHPTLTITSDADSALMDRGVMPPTEQDQILEVGAAALNPWDHVMSIQMPGLVAAWIAHILSRIIRALRSALLTRRRVRPNANTSPCLSITAPSTALSQSNLCAAEDHLPTSLNSHLSGWSV
jgi:hypothetical protein